MIGLLAQETVAERTVVVEDLLDGDRRDADASQRQHRLVPVEATGRVGQRQVLDPLDHWLRRRLRMRLVDRRQVFQPTEPLRPEPPLPFVIASPVQPPLAAGLGDVAEFLGQFQNAQAAFRSRWRAAAQFPGSRSGKRDARKLLYKQWSESPSYIKTSCIERRTGPPHRGQTS